MSIHVFRGVLLRREGRKEIRQCLVEEEAVREGFISDGRNSIVLEGGAQWRGVKSTAQGKRRELLEQSL